MPSSFQILTRPKPNILKALTPTHIIYTVPHIFHKAGIFPFRRRIDQPMFYRIVMDIFDMPL